MDPLGELAALVAAEGGLLAEALRPAEAGGVAAEPPALALARRAAAGTRARGREEDYALAVAAIREGYELHYAGAGTVLHPGDPDLALLAGDRLYALGLARLAELEDVEAVQELADVIALGAAAHAEGDPARAEAAWAAGALAVGHGPPAGHREAKDAARAGDPGAAEALAAVARQADQAHSRPGPEPPATG